MYIYIYQTSGLNSKFSFFHTGCHSKVKEPCLPFYLLFAGGRIVGVIPFPKVLALCEMGTDLQSRAGFELGPLRVL